jgi:hypothetical protein
MLTPINIEEKIANLVLAGAVSVTWDVDWFNDESDINRMDIEYFDGSRTENEGLLGGVDPELWNMVWHLDGPFVNDGKYKLNLHSTEHRLERVGETEFHRYPSYEYNDEDDFDGSTDRYNDEGGYY